MVDNFTDFAPLGVVLVAMIGVAFVQVTDATVQRSAVLTSIVLALFAAGRDEEAEELLDLMIAEDGGRAACQVAGDRSKIALK